MTNPKNDIKDYGIHDLRTIGFLLNNFFTLKEIIDIASAFNIVFPPIDISSREDKIKLIVERASRFDQLVSLLEHMEQMHPEAFQPLIGIEAFSSTDKGLAGFLGEVASLVQIQRLIINLGLDIDDFDTSTRPKLIASFLPYARQNDLISSMHQLLKEDFPDEYANHFTT